MGDFPTPAEHGEAMAQIAAEGGAQAIELVTTLMEYNARIDFDMMTKLYEGMEADRDRWMARALEAENQLDLVQYRFNRLFGRSPILGLDPFDEE